MSIEFCLTALMVILTPGTGVVFTVSVRRGSLCRSSGLACVWRWPLDDGRRW
ncbi:hypothetical protein [Actinopolymorpha rutila]|uniref:LysE type translocator n=1 Tax=Actinopolymorpha rutila TaxID=446787 RepID=A0A852ZH09_9ACTN|nr:hypothetical protein [Actinopolymorpha rutila]NYH91198.1 hypothetical protein [Actinopolymorpha rutila]